MEFASLILPFFDIILLPRKAGTGEKRHARKRERKEKRDCEVFKTNYLYTNNKRVFGVFGFVLGVGRWECIFGGLGVVV